MATPNVAPAQDNPWEVVSESPSKPTAAPAPAAPPVSATVPPATTPSSTQPSADWEVVSETPSTKPSLLSKIGGAVSAYGEAENKFSKGLWEGAGQTVGTVSNLINKIPVVGETLAPKQGITALKEMSKPESALESAGVTAESIGEFMAGDEAFAALGAAKKLGIATKLADMAKTSPRLAAILTHGIQAVRQGAVVGVQQYAHGASPTDALKTAGIATLLGASTGAVVEGGGPLYEKTKGLIDPDYLQKPIADTLKEVSEDALARAKALRAGDNLPTPPEPKAVTENPDWVHRVRHAQDEVERRGIPESSPISHGQVSKTEHPEWVDSRGLNTDADTVARRDALGLPPGRNVPQQRTRIDMNAVRRDNIPFTENTAIKVPEGAKPEQRFDFPKGLPEKYVHVMPSEGWDMAPKQPNPFEDLLQDKEPDLTPKSPTKSMRVLPDQAGDAHLGLAKDDYGVLDRETRGDLKTEMNKLRIGRQKLRRLGTGEDDEKQAASILRGQKQSEENIYEMFNDLQNKGIDPRLIKRADASFRQSQAAYEFGDKFRKAISGAHPDATGDLADAMNAKYPETVNPIKAHKVISDMFDSGRLQDWLGKEGAEKVFHKTLETSAAYKQILQNQKTAMTSVKIGGLVAGGGAAAHYLPGLAFPAAH